MGSVLRFCCLIFATQETGKWDIGRDFKCKDVRLQIIQVEYFVGDGRIIKKNPVKIMFVATKLTVLLTVKLNITLLLLEINHWKSGQ